MKISKKRIIEIIKEEILDEAESTALKSVKGGIRRATNPTLPPEVLAKNIEAMSQQLKDEMRIDHSKFDGLSTEEKVTAELYAGERMKTQLPRLQQILLRVQLL